jgi:hypothetical protein
LAALREAEEREIQELLKTDPEFRKQYEAIPADPDIPSDDELKLGEWPSVSTDEAALRGLVEDWDGKPFETVHIVLVPTSDWTMIPAYLRWGGWNLNPPAKYHVAALRSWRGRYGAELVGLRADAMHIRVGKRPGTREEALRLAREQHVYCSEDELSILRWLAARLMGNDWWFFWWD